MQEKPKRGRPATGRILNKQLTARLTEDEKQEIVNFMNDNNLTVRELLLLAIKHNLKKYFKKSVDLLNA